MGEACRWELGTCWCQCKSIAFKGRVQQSCDSRTGGSANTCQAIATIRMPSASERNASLLILRSATRTILSAIDRNVCAPGSGSSSFAPGYKRPPSQAMLNYHAGSSAQNRNVQTVKLWQKGCGMEKGHSQTQTPNLCVQQPVRGEIECVYLSPKLPASPETSEPVN